MEKKGKKIITLFSLYLVIFGQQVYLNYFSSDKIQNFLPKNYNDIQIKSSAILFEQNFDSEIPADAVDWRIPTGWHSPTPPEYPGGQNLYPITSSPNVNSGPINTNHIALIDAQSDDDTYIYRTLPAISEGSLNFTLFLYPYFDYTTQGNLFLQNLERTNNILNFSAFKPDSTDLWDVSLEGIYANISIFQNQSIEATINFNGITADLIINGTEVISDIPYSGGIVQSIELNSFNTTYGESHFDSFLLYSDLSYIQDIPVLNPIDGLDRDGSYTLSWASVNEAESYQLYRENMIIVDVSSLVPIYSGNLTSYSEVKLSDGLYFYCLVATNILGSSNLSEISFVRVDSSSNFEDTNNIWQGYNSGDNILECKEENKPVMGVLFNSENTGQLKLSMLNFTPILIDDVANIEASYFYQVESISSTFIPSEFSLIISIPEEYNDITKANLKIYKLNGSTWIPLTNTIIMEEENTILASKLNEFGQFALGYKIKSFISGYSMNSVLCFILGCIAVLYVNKNKKGEKNEK